jgi:hypothetical protein
MYRKLLLAGLAAAFLAEAPAEAQDKAARANAKARLAAARKAYEGLLDRYKAGPPPADGREVEPRPPFPELCEQLYRWSGRWAEAQQELSDRKADRVAAAQAHLDRMSGLEKTARKLKSKGFLSAAALAGIEFYRLDAERHLLRAKKR